MIVMLQKLKRYLTTSGRVRFYYIQTVERGYMHFTRKQLQIVSKKQAKKVTQQIYISCFSIVAAAGVRVAVATPHFR